MLFEKIHQSIATSFPVADGIALVPQVTLGSLVAGIGLPTGIELVGVRLLWKTPDVVDDTAEDWVIFTIGQFLLSEADS